MKNKNFERDIPEGYKPVKYINAKDAKFGIIFNLIALVVLVAVMAVAIPPLASNPLLDEGVDLTELSISMWAFVLATVVYMILHELTHGIPYKKLTGEKLTFGMSWSCAFCGVPHIYVYRKTALIAVLAPFTVFTLIFIPLTVALYFVNPIYYIFSALMSGLHLGGCSGDLYVTYLLLFKYKDEKTLMRDTGPEQYFYVPAENE